MVDVNLIPVLAFLYLFISLLYKSLERFFPKTGSKYFYYQEGTKGLLHLFPPSSTFSWYLIHLETSLHWSSTSTNLHDRFLPLIGGGKKVICLPGVHLNEHGEAWAFGFLGLLHPQQSGSVREFNNDWPTTNWCPVWLSSLVVYLSGYWGLLLPTRSHHRTFSPLKSHPKYLELCPALFYYL